MARTARIAEIPSIGTLDRAAGNLSHDRDVVGRAARAGVAVRAVSPTFAPGTGRPGLILGFGGFGSAQMKAAAQRLAAVIADVAGAADRRARVRPSR